MVVCNGVPARVTSARQLADFVPGIEDRLQRIVGVGSPFPRVKIVPELRVALGSGEEARFGEPEVVGHGEGQMSLGSLVPAIFVHWRR